MKFWEIPVHVSHMWRGVIVQLAIRDYFKMCKRKRKNFRICDFFFSEFDFVFVLLF